MEEKKIPQEFHEYRRFEIINQENEDKFSKLANEKNLSREDLILILSSVRLRRF